MAEPDPADVNPYAPPAAPLGEAPVAAEGELAEAEAIRRRYLSHEASVKSIGSLHYLAAALCVLVLVGLTATLAAQSFRNNQAIQFVLILLFYVAVLAYHAAMGYGLTRLKTWARWIEAVLVGLALLLVLGVIVIAVIVTVSAGRPSIAGGAVVIVFYGVVGLVLSYVMYLLLGKKGTVVFSREYRAVIDRTPHIKYRSSCLLLFLIVLFVVVVGMVVFWSFAPRKF